MSNDSDSYRKNNDDLLTGEQIVGLLDSGNRQFMWMGRSGGIDGDLVARDIVSGRWKTQDYEVRHEPLPGNPNWFSIGSFVALTEQADDKATPNRLAPKPEPVGWDSAGRNADAKLLGQRIYDGYKADTLEYTFMGRTGGREGPELIDDLATQGWRSRHYEVRFNRISGNRNWFSIRSFVNGIDLRDQNPEAAGEDPSAATRMYSVCFVTKPRAQVDDGDICVDCA
jgi:hypothetical protein